MGNFVARRVRFTDYPEGLLLITAAIERARLDVDNKKDCELIGHSLSECSSEILLGLETYVALESEASPVEIALEFMRLADNG